jgi:aminoglycoside phosphotransferase (APT) family kinase protein
MTHPPSEPGRLFCKEYGGVERAAVAVANHRWLRQLGVPTPRLIHASGTHLCLEHVTGRHARPADIPALAATLAGLHATAFTTALHAACLDEPFRAGGLTIPDFLRPRVAAIHRRLGEHQISASALTATEAEALLTAAEHEPAAFYKDCNVRNVLITNTATVLIDFDDLTLAPFGYDLAKLLISTAMTYGRQPASLYHDATSAYTTALRRHGGPPARTGLADIAQWIEIHHILTSPYRHTNYRYSWPSVRPW